MVDKTELERVAEAARAIYCLPAADFISARTTHAKELKQAGHGDAARLVGAFRKPSAAASAVNRLMTHDPGLADEIAGLGSRLRTAQATADASELRSLDRERRDLVTRAREAAQAAEPRATSATLNDVEQTVWAAVVDAQAGSHVLGATLVRALSPGGFGEVDASGASAIDVAPLADEPRTDARPARLREEARTALAQAQAAHEAAQDALMAASRAADDATRRHDDLERERDELRARLTTVEEALRTTVSEATDAGAAVREAERRRRTAAAEVDRALRAIV